MNGYKVLRLRQTGQTNAGTAVMISSPRLLPDEIQHIKYFGLANKSGETVTIILGITDISGFLPIAQGYGAADGEAYAIQADICLAEGDQLSALVTGTANKSTVTLFAFGTLSGSPQDENPTVPQA